MKKKAILFDFDGTLADTLPGIMATMAAVKARMGADYTAEEAAALVGQPLAAMGNILVGAERSGEFVNAYFAEFPHHGMSSIRFYDGVRAMLERFCHHGLSLNLVTSKRKTSLDVNLEVLKAYHFFDVLVTSDKTMRHKPHPEPVEFALNELGREPAECFMVGDTQYDLLAAGGAGVESIAVTWGIEKRESLQQARPTYTVNTVAQLENLILAHS